MAGKVVWGTSMSIDGFVAGPDHAMDWMALDWLPDVPNGDLSKELADGTGAVLAGRNWHDELHRLGGLEGMYGGQWTGPVLVLTHRPEPPSPYDRVTFITGDIESAVAAAREAANGKDVAIFGPTLGAQCLDAGLLDELVVGVAPVLLGDGIRLFGGPGQATHRLEPVGVRPAGHYAYLRYRVVT
jgi:dihydrofolate reductase